MLLARATQAKRAADCYEVRGIAITSGTELAISEQAMEGGGDDGDVDRENACAKVQITRGNLLLALLICPTCTASTWQSFTCVHRVQHLPPVYILQL